MNDQKISWLKVITWNVSSMWQYPSIDIEKNYRKKYE